MRTPRFFLAIVSVLCGLLPAAALAANYATLGAYSAASILPSIGAGGFVDLAYYVFARFRPLLTGVAILVTTIMAFRMMLAQEDEAIENAKTVMIAVCSGLVLMYLIEPFILAFYGSSGEIFRGNMSAGATIVSTQVSGLINWALVVVASLAVMMIILGGVQALLKGTGEEGTGMIRKTLARVAAGVIILVFRVVLANGFVSNTGNPVPIISDLMRIVSFALAFLALIAILIAVYAGISVIVSFGKEEQMQKAKSLLFRAIVGILVIFISLALVNFVITPGLE